MALACAKVCFMLIPYCLCGSQLKEGHFPSTRTLGIHSQSRMQQVTGPQVLSEGRCILCCQLFEEEIVLR